AAAALADGPQVAEADGPFAGAAAARPGADQAETADAVGLADLVADETTEHVGRVVTERRVAPEDRGDVRALGLLEDAQDAGVLRLLLGELLGQVRIGVILRALQAVETLLVLGGLLPHLPFLALVALALATLLRVVLLLEELGDVLFLLLRRLDEELHEAVVAVEEVERQRLRVRRNREDHEQEEGQGHCRADGVDLLAPLPGEERDLQRARPRGPGDDERRLAAVEADRTARRQREAGAALLDELLQLVALAVDVDLAGHARGDVDDVVGARRGDQRMRRRRHEVRRNRRVDLGVRADHEVGVRLAAPLETHVAERETDDEAAEHEDRHDRVGLIPDEVLRLLARRLPVLVSHLLGALVDRGDDEGTQADDDARDAAVQHRGPLRVRRLPLGVEEMARARDDAAEDSLDLHRARAVVDLDLSPSAGRAGE